MLFEVLPFAEKAALKNPVGLAAGGGGVVYVADMGLHAILRIDNNGDVVVLAGGKSKGYADGKGGAALFYRPTALALDSQGNLIVCDTGNNRIRRVAPDGTVSTVAGSGEEGCKDGAAALLCSFKAPQGVAVDSKDVIYVADTLNDAIRKITPNGVVSTVAGTAGQRGRSDGVGASASFDRPVGLWLDEQGVLYVADSQNNCVRTVDLDTGAVKKWVGCGQRGHRDGVVKHAGFALPTCVIADSKGNLFVADTDNNCIRRVNARGEVETVAGSKEGCAAGLGDQALFNKPRAMLLDPFSSTLLVADSGNALIRKLRPVNEVEWHQLMLKQALQFKDDACREVSGLELELLEAQKRKASAIVAFGLAQRHLDEAKARNRPLLPGHNPPLLL